MVSYYYQICFVAGADDSGGTGDDCDDDMGYDVDDNDNDDLGGVCVENDADDGNFYKWYK